MWASSFALSIAFRRSGWQWAFGDGDTLRVYRTGDRALLAELPAAFVYELIRHYLTGHALQTQVGRYQSPLPPPEPLPLAKADGPAPRLPAATGRRLRGRA